MWRLSFIYKKELERDEERADLNARFSRLARFMASFEAAILAEITLAGLEDPKRSYAVDNQCSVVTVTIGGGMDEKIVPVFNNTVNTVSITQPDWEYLQPQSYPVTSSRGGSPPSIN